MQLRYQLINSNFSAAARIAHRAIGYKKCCGGKSYVIAALCEACGIKYDKFDLYIDDQLYFENIESVLLMLFNGNLCGGGMIVDPFAVMNDGLVDVVI